jgi:hypothetical protein
MRPKVLIVRIPRVRAKGRIGRLTLPRSKETAVPEEKPPAAREGAPSGR